MHHVRYLRKGLRHSETQERYLRSLNLLLSNTNNISISIRSYYDGKARPSLTMEGLKASTSPALPKLLRSGRTAPSCSKRCNYIKQGGVQAHPTEDLVTLF